MSRHGLAASRLNMADEPESTALHSPRGEAAGAIGTRGLPSSDMPSARLLVAGSLLIVVLALTLLALHPRSLCGGVSEGKAEVRCPLLF